MKRPLLLLFDGHALVHRAYHALPPFSVSKTGEPTGAVFGFTRMLLKAVQDHKPTHWAISFDRPSPTFRHLEFEDYKAHRPSAPEDLRQQMTRVREIVNVFNIPTFELEGYEADDVLGTLAREAERRRIDTIIVTGDNDLLQLASSCVKVLLPKRAISETVLYDAEAVKERFGVTPDQMVDYKALKGDPSDNIPGVSGVGDKTAAKLIQRFGSIEDIYDHLDEVEPAKLRQALINDRDLVVQGKRMSTIVTDAPVEFDLDCCEARPFDRSRLVELFRSLEFFSLAEKLPEIEGLSPAPAEAVPPAYEAEYTAVDTEQALVDLAGRLSLAESFALRLAGQSSRRGAAPALTSLAVSLPGNGTFYVNLAQDLWNQASRLDPGRVLDLLRPVLSDVRSGKLCHNGKGIINRLADYDTRLANLSFDTMLAAYLLGEKSLELRDLAPARLGMEMAVAEPPVPLETFDGAGLPPDARVVCDEASVIARLSSMFEAELREGNLWDLFKEVEMPLVPVLAGMERTGVALDTGALRQMSQTLGEQLACLEEDICQMAGTRFNINSPQQLGAVLFGTLKIPGGRKTKTGYSTDAAILEKLRLEYPVVDLVLQYRQLAKLKSTYIDSLPALINPSTGRLHTSFNQTVTATGRLSSSDPNLQNIPIRGELGRQVRRAFISRPPCLLLSGDYSQIELRILAHLSQDVRLLEAFRQDEDVHAATAAEVFGVGIQAVTPDMRRIAKVINFGIAYGMSDYGLMQATELSRQEAGLFIAAYFEKYAGVKAYLDRTKQQAHEDGYVHTLLGRKRYLPELRSSNRQVKEAAERMAINMPVQGTAADIIKLAMISLSREIEERRLESRMTLQVHDELLIEVPPQELDLMKGLMKEAMSEAFALDVPLKVDIKAGRNWGEMDKDD